MSVIVVSKIKTKKKNDIIFTTLILCPTLIATRDRSSRDRMIVRFTTTFAINAHHH